MKYFAIVLIYLGISTAFAFDVKSGIYHNLNSTDPYACSWQVVYDPQSQSLTAYSVDQYNGNFNCQKSMMKSFQCQDANGIKVCGETGLYPTFIYYFKAVDSQTILASSEDAIWNLGTLKYVGEKGLSPSKFRATPGNGFTYLGGFNCTLPNGKVMACEDLTDKELQPFCAGLQAKAELMALGTCQASGHSDCHILSSKTFIAKIQPADLYHYWSGCRGEAIATFK